MPAQIINGGFIQGPVSSTGLAAFESTLAALNPIIWWKLDEPSGSTANDSGSEGVDGTHQNTPSVGVDPGPFSGSLAIGYDRASTEFTDATSVATSLLAPMSMVALFRVTALSVGDGQWIMSSGNSASSVRYYGAAVGADNTLKAVIRGASGTTVIPTSAPSVGEWHLAVATFDASGVPSISMDGESLITAASGRSPDVLNQVATGVLFRTTNDGPFGGRISQAAWVKSVLNQDDVDSLWAACGEGSAFTS